MYLRHLYPAPKSFSENESERFAFGSRVAAPITESACLLRRLYDALGDSDRAGWSLKEVPQQWRIEEFYCRRRHYATNRYHRST